MVALTRRCQRPKADGRPCEAPPLRDGLLCFAHDPERSDEMAEARRLGGLRRLLDSVVLDTLQLENSNARSRTLIAIAMGRVRLAEVEATIAPPIVIETEARDENAR